MPRILLALAMMLAAAPAFAQPAAPAPGPHAGAGPPKPAMLKLPQGPMQVDNWASLGTYAELPTGDHKLDVKVQPDNTEEITVYGTRNKRDREWRDEIHDSAGPGYEPGASEAGQPQYAKGPEWSSPEEQHVMSGAKDAAGACGALFGLITCPDK
jgi:hypothetical protein